MLSSHSLRESFSLCKSLDEKLFFRKLILRTCFRSQNCKTSTVMVRWERRRAAAFAAGWQRQAQSSLQFHSDHWAASVQLLTLYSHQQSDVMWCDVNDLTFSQGALLRGDQQVSSRSGGDSPSLLCSCEIPSCSAASSSGSPNTKELWT